MGSSNHPPTSTGAKKGKQATRKMNYIAFTQNLVPILWLREHHYQTSFYLNRILHHHQHHYGKQKKKKRFYIFGFRLFVEKLPPGCFQFLFFYKLYLQFLFFLCFSIFPVFVRLFSLLFFPFPFFFSFPFCSCSFLRFSLPVSLSLSRVRIFKILPYRNTASQ